MPTNKAKTDSIAKTASESLLHKIMLMSCDADSVKNIGRELLDFVRGFTGEHDVADQSVKEFCEQLTLAVLEWLGRGEARKVEELSELLSGVFAGASQERIDFESLRPGLRLVAKIDGLLSVIALSLRTSNFTMALGSLMAPRRQSWRTALEFIWRSRKPISAKDVKPVFRENAETTVYAMLNELVKRNLLAKNNEGEQSVTYQTTWHGERVCRALFNPDLETALVAPLSALTETAGVTKQQVQSHLSFAAPASAVDADSMLERPEEAEGSFRGSTAVNGPASLQSTAPSGTENPKGFFIDAPIAGPIGSSIGDDEKVPAALVVENSLSAGFPTSPDRDHDNSVDTRVSPPGSTFSFQLESDTEQVLTDLAKRVVRTLQGQLGYNMTHVRLTPNEVKAIGRNSYILKRFAKPHRSSATTRTRSPRRDEDSMRSVLFAVSLPRILKEGIPEADRELVRPQDDLLLRVVDKELKNSSVAASLRE